MEKYGKSPISISKESWYWAAGNSKAMGVRVWISPHAQFKEEDVLGDPKGCFIVLKVVVGKITFGSIYRPNMGQEEILRSMLNKESKITLRRICTGTCNQKR